MENRDYFDATEFQGTDRVEEEDPKDPKDRNKGKNRYEEKRAEKDRRAAKQKRREDEYKKMGIPPDSRSGVIE